MPKRVARTTGTLGKRDLPTLEQGVARIVAMYNACSPTLRNHGQAWYDEAQAFARELASTSWLSVNQCAAIIAALSPMSSWATNKLNAAAVVGACNAGASARMLNGLAATPANLSKCEAIAIGTNPEDVLGTRKTWYFYCAIIGDTNAVCVDRWAARVVTGTNVETVGTAAYAPLVAMYRAAAALVGDTPRNVQAVTWCAIREGHG